MKKFIIAIDGGGTKTVGVLADMHGEILNYKVGGPSNPNDIGEKAARNTLTSIIRELADAEEGWIDSVYAGISGAIGNETLLRRAVSEACPDAKIKVASDIYNLFALLDGDTSRDAAVIICGTGGVCFARKDGALHRIGGWGYLLDNFGGAYSVGRDGLEAALRYHDGRGEPTELYARAEAYLGAKPEHSIKKIYAEGKTFIAGFAPEVLHACEAGDAVAARIVDSAIDGICGFIDRAYDIIGKKFDCVVGGGLIYNSYMKSRLLALPDDKARIIYPEKEQIYGALKLALELSKEN
jgi:N-acetylglucosamine kinase-like BadF-type ATPase